MTYKVFGATLSLTESISLCRWD